MDNSYILSRVDHTLLTPTANWSQIELLCDEAVAYKTASVCVPPCYVSRIHNSFPDLNICTVIGFPLGYTTHSTKVAEALTAVEDGASELDMVINITDVKNSVFSRVEYEISKLKNVLDKKILKIIVETCYLTESEKIALCRVVTDAGADYIKTSTGFGTAGATIEDIQLFKKHIGPNVKIKASGGIRTREDMVAYIKNGCDRLGTSSAIKILTVGDAQGY